MITSRFVELQPAFDALALLFLQPERLGAASALPAAAETILEAAQGGPALPAELLGKLERIASQQPPSDLEFAQAYARLFLGVSEETIPLCESAWTSAQRLNCQAAQLECRRAYEEAGLELSGGSVVPEDHLGLMLGFLAVTALRGDEAAGLEFAAKHAAPMMETIARATAAKGAAAGPYADAAALLEGAAALLTPDAK